jgi:hypothetical protein
MLAIKKGGICSPFFSASRRSFAALRLLTAYFATNALSFRLLSEALRMPLNDFRHARGQIFAQFRTVFHTQTRLISNSRLFKNQQLHIILKSLSAYFISVRVPLNYD